MNMKSQLLPTLSIRNPVLRENHILFDEPTHKYTITTDPDSKYTSVTTWVHSHFPHFDADSIIQNMMKGKKWNSQNKYWNKTPEEIKKEWSDNANSVSSSGTDLHYEIECFMNQDLHLKNNRQMTTHDLLLYNYKTNLDLEIQESKPIEWKYFLDFVENYSYLQPYRTELRVYDEDVKLSGSIDMIYENDDGTLMIYDWKRCKSIDKSGNFNKFALTEQISHIPDTNFWHYSLQLNIYKAIIERKYDKKVTNLYLVQLHPNQKNYKLIECADLSKEVEELFALRETQFKK